MLHGQELAYIGKACITVVYLLKARTVEIEKQPLLGRARSIRVLGDVTQQ
jgi:hypothetical protein